MPTITADKIIGKTLIAKVNVSKLSGTFNKVATFAPGETIGIVYSYTITLRTNSQTTNYNTKVFM